MEKLDSIAASLEQPARACRILEMEGHGDLSLGHLSMRDPQGRGFWMKRNRIGLGEVCGPQDFVLVSFDGEKLEGEGGRHSEWRKLDWFSATHGRGHTAVFRQQ